MITKNWYNYFKSVKGYTTVPGGAVTVDGLTVDCGYYSAGSANMLDALVLRTAIVIYKTTTSGIILGSGTTAPTINDYKLEQQITSGLSCSVSTTYDADGNTTRIITATNTSSAPITIAEIGYLSNIYTSANNTSNNKYVLMDRTLLQVPVTIPAGAVGVISYTIEVNVPE